MPAQQFILQRCDSKQEWTNILLQHYFVAHDYEQKNLSPAQKTLLFWYNVSAHTGMRLNGLGFQLMETIGYNFVKCQINRNFVITSGLLVRMDKQIQLPWFLGPQHHISLLDDKLAGLLIITDGDLSQALDINS
jgi:hypothetical protein